MKSNALFLSTALLLAACGSSHDERGALATPQPSALDTPQRVAPKIKYTDVSPRGIKPGWHRVVIATPQSSAPAAAVNSPTAAAITPQSGASEAAKARLGAPVTPQSGALEAAKAAGAESREMATPKSSDVPASGVTGAASADAAPSGVTSAVVGDALPPGVPYASDTDPVRIVSYMLSSTVIHPGDDITGDVVTSSNAASVTAKVGSFSVSVPKVAPGKFHLHMQMPSVPLPPGDAKLIITAIRTDGTSTTREVAITVAL